MENSETSVWLDFAFSCRYINETVYKELIAKNEEVGKMLNHILNNPDSY